MMGSDGLRLDLQEFALGLNVHRLYWPDVLENLQELNTGSTRIGVSWQECADEKGRILPLHKNFTSILKAPELVSNSIVVLQYSHPVCDFGGRPLSQNAQKLFANYAADCVGVLSKRDHYFEIWNEWNCPGMYNIPLSEGSGKAIDYISLCKNTTPMIRMKDTNAFIIGGATWGIGDSNNYIPNLLRLGLLDWIDGLSIHPYFYGSPDKSERLPEKGLPIRIKKVKGWLSKYPKGPTTPIYVTELGWPTYDKGDGVTPEVQAKFMARSILLLAEDPQIKGVWIYELRDGGTNPADPEHHFGLIKNDGTPKPAFWVMKDLKKVLDDSKSIETMPVKDSDSLVMMRLPSKERGTRWLCWTIQPDTRWKLRISGLGMEGAVKVSPLGRFGFPDGWRDEKEGAEIEVGDLPVCIESSSSKLVMESVGPMSSVSPAATPPSRVSKPSSAESEILPTY